MTLFSFIFAMLLEQFRPVRDDSRLAKSIERLFLKMEQATNSGEISSARMSWFAVVVGGTLLTWLVVALLTEVNVFLGFLANVGVLYLCIGFRHFSNRFTDIQLALANNDLDSARLALRKWLEHSGGDVMTRLAAESGDASAICREAIRLALVGAQRHVFGVIFWFVILPGPAGAVLYRLSAEARRVWADARDPSIATSSGAARQSPFGDFAVRAFAWVDWFPSRVTAIVFAIVGNFEDAILMWRFKSGFAPHKNDTERVILSAGAGAMGVRLSVPEAPSVSIRFDEPSETEALGGPWPSLYQDMPELREANEAALRSAVGLVWRALILWVALVLLVSIGHWLGWLA
ncbi:MAG: CobD/CbiB family protein [Burkholderiaceae bacterium]|nr:CobD/CbiB family protein [Burkholderiaceae bacterium]